MKIAIHQPNFLPWLGYFHRMSLVDTFVLFDDVQFPRGKTIISRVRIKSANGACWITVPVKDKSGLRPINAVQIANEHRWQDKLWRTIEAAYGKARYFEQYAGGLKRALFTDWERLVNLNAVLIKLMARHIGIDAQIVLSSTVSDSQLAGTEKIFDILRGLNATEYVTGCGEGSKRYIDPADFERKGIRLIYQNFRHPEYPQLWGEFEAGLSAVDALFNVGADGMRGLINVR